MLTSSKPNPQQSLFFTLGEGLDQRHPLYILAGKIAMFHRVLLQTRETKDKIYSLHEPDVLCIGKGKDHKKYEASFVPDKKAAIFTSDSA